MADRKGFTLIELLVVLVIIGVALAFIIPNFINSIEQTKAQAAKNNLLAISAAQQKYFEDFQVYCTTTTPTVTAPLCGDSLVHLVSNLQLTMNNDVTFVYSCTAAGPICTAQDTNYTPNITLSLNVGTVTCAPAGPVCDSLN
jgi:prepilin-type N-terminal cleavage/methylation domain-containing protein